MSKQTDTLSGVTKAWVNFNGTGTPAARDSFNFASLTDHGTGIYAVNMSSAFVNNDFAPSFTSGFESGANGRTVTFSSSAFTTTSFTIRTTLTTTDEDQTVITGSVHGDLA